jgi:hypothetical protein
VKRSQDLQLKRLKEIEPFIRRSAQGRVRKDHAFLNCLRASLSKSFEFCLEVYEGRSDRMVFFFLAPSLRSICEDLIVLSYMTKMSRSDRNELILLLMHEEMASRIAAQSKFFELARPDQLVVRSGSIDQTGLEDSIRQIWKRNGWAGLTSSWMPTTRQIAEKNHIDVLSTLYDYIYRLTSGAVHFNPGVLLRTGWGKSDRLAHFSVKNFNPYWVEYARTYGLLLFCCYFELFGRLLRPDRKIARLVIELRFDLVGQMRWPEMVTHEELNLKPPTISALDHTKRFMYRYIDAWRRQRKLLGTPADKTMSRQFNRLVQTAWRSPEIQREIARITNSRKHQETRTEGKKPRHGGYPTRNGMFDASR